MAAQVVIVDDDDFYAEILQDLLAMEGYEPRHFLSGKECLEALDGADPVKADVFILDVVMPEMDGYALCAELRKRPLHAKTPILFVSSKSSLDDRMKGYEAGGNDYLSKPAQPDELNAKLRLALEANPSSGPSAPLTASDSSLRDSTTTEILSLAEMCAYGESLRGAQTTEAVAEALLAEIRRLGLAASLLMRGTEHALFLCSDGGQSPIEKELLELAPPDRARVAFNQRLILNREVLALLVRRLPADDGAGEEWINALTLLAQLADQRAAIVSGREAFAAERRYWVELLKNAEQGIADLKGQTEFKGATVADILEEFLITMNEAMVDLALEEDQEKILKAKLKTQVQHIEGALTDRTLSANEALKPFRGLIEKLSSTG